MTLSNGTVQKNKNSTEYDFGREFSGAACGRNRRGAGGAPPWRRQAADTGRGGRRPPLPVRKTGNLISRNRELLHGNRERFAREQGSFCAIPSTFAPPRNAPTPSPVRSYEQTSLSSSSSSAVLASKSIPLKGL